VSGLNYLFSLMKPLENVVLNLSLGSIKFYLDFVHALTIMSVAGRAGRFISVFQHSIILAILSPGIASISDSVNLNKYIDIFPSTYFVKIFSDTLVSENVGPSKVPLTLIKFSYRKYLSRHLICQIEYSPCSQ
jgi:hypothetical protein